MLADTIINNVTSISFYHQIINSETNKLSYAEEYTYTETEISGETQITETYFIDSLKNYVEYKTSSQIVLSNVSLSNIGKSTDNKYYFAISQNENTNDDDVFANNGANSNSYGLEDALDVLEESMTELKTSQSITTEEERTIVKSSEISEEETSPDDTIESSNDEPVQEEAIETEEETVEDEAA